MQESVAGPSGVVNPLVTVAGPRHRVRQTITVSCAVSLLDVRKAKKSLRLMLTGQPSSRVKLSDSSDVSLQWISARCGHRG